MLLIHLIFCCILQPGHGSHYVRHLDAPRTPGSLLNPTSEATGSAGHRGVRKLTFIYYLNEQNTGTTTSTTEQLQQPQTSVQERGGQLRVFCSSSSATTLNPYFTFSHTNTIQTAPSSNTTLGGVILNPDDKDEVEVAGEVYMDIKPTFGKLIVFRR